MKRIVSYTLLLLFIIPASLLGQVESSKSEAVLDDVFCKPKDFQFRLEYENDDLVIESFFLTGEEVYLCTSTLPFNLMIVNTAHEQIMPFEITWLKEVIVDGVGGSLSEIGGDILEINEDDYFEDNVIRINISVKFKLSQMEPYQELELVIYRNRVDFTQINGTSNYAHDDNKIEGYIRRNDGDLSQLNTPWNFLLIGSQDTQGNPIPPNFLRGKIDKEKWTSFVPEKIISDDNLLVINPDQVAPDREANISFDHNSLTNDKIIEVHSCDKEPELLLYAGGVETIDIQVFNVCESDDDMRLIPHLATAPNEDPMAVCISPGPDGTLDLERNLTFYIDQGDMYHGETHTQFVQVQVVYVMPECFENLLIQGVQQVQQVQQQYQIVPPSITFLKTS